MKIRNSIYAALMVAIYVIATLCSSLSVILCTHEHHHHDHTTHHHHNSEEECCCDGLTFEANCCNHHHRLLGENHTDYIASPQRFDSRISHSVLLMLMPVVLATVLDEIPDPSSDDLPLCGGDERSPLYAAFISRESLRAPPVFA